MFDKEKYDEKYKKENYYRILLLLPKVYKAKIADFAEKKGVSRNKLIKMAIDAYMGKKG